MATGAGSRPAAPVSRGFLYGDSTPSPLQTDFIAFLRDAVDFAVAVLACDARVTGALQRVGRVAEATDREIERAEAFAAEVMRAVDRAGVGEPDSLAARCAARIRQGIRDLVRSEADGAQTAVANERTRAAQIAAAEQEGCLRALEPLLLRHSLPDSIAVVRVHLEAGVQYDAQLHGRTTYGLEWAVGLEIPTTHPLGHVLRVDRIFERLEVEAPEEGGWLRKETKNRPQRLDRLHVVELTADPTETAVKLRVTPEGSSAGFDLLFERDSPKVLLARTLEGGQPADAPYEITGEDAAKLRALEDALVAMARELAEHKKSLLVASLDDTPIRQIDSPRLLADRLIANIAPTVQEIARRSLSPGELVIKRLLSDNHREELFVSKAELRQKLGVLPQTLHGAFEALHLWDTPSAAPPPAAPAPSPAPVAAASLEGAPTASEDTAATLAAVALAAATASPPATPGANSLAPATPAEGTRPRSERPPGAGQRAPRPEGLTSTQPYPLPVRPEGPAPAATPPPSRPNVEVNEPSAPPPRPSGPPRP
jgi:hypothetical protein